MNNLSTATSQLTPERHLLARITELDKQAEKGLLFLPVLFFTIGIGFLVIMLILSLLTYHNGHDMLHQWLYAHIWFFAAPAFFFVFALGTPLAFYNDAKYGAARETLVRQELTAWDSKVITETCKLSACPAWVCQLVLNGV